MKNKSIKWMRIVCLLCMIGLSALNANSKPIDKDVAMQIAQRHLSKTHKFRAAASKEEKQTVSFVMEGEEQTFYVFNIGKDNGFIVVSGEDATEEILMSCEKGHFSVGEMPDNMMAWLRSYSKQIKRLREKGVTREQNLKKSSSFDKRYKLEEDAEKADRLARWDQGGFYGNQELFNYGFPKLTNEKGITATVPVGCVPTAVAEFLYYYQWPKEIGPEDIPDYTTQTWKMEKKGYKAGTKIDWNNIKRIYYANQEYSEEERKAISDLMKMAATAFKTDYEFGEGTAFFSNTPSVLQKYFNFENVELCSRFKDENEWLQKIYDELRTNGPVLYRGYDKKNDAGHAFLIVGIEGKYVWVNWGWGVYSSTYTLLSVCDNDFEGNDYAFKKDQYAIFGAKPNKTGKRIDMALKVLTNTLLSKTNNVFSRNSEEDDFENIPIEYTYTNINDDATFDIGFLVQNIETGEETFYPLFSRTLKGLKTTTANLKFSFGSNLDDGIYRIYGASREYGTDEYHPNYNKTSEYIEITISGNKLYFGEIVDQQSHSLLDYTYANGCEYKLYGEVDYTDSRSNPDGVVFYKTNLLLDVKKDGKTTTYVVDNGNIYNSSTYENMMFPCMMLDLDNDRMYVFHNSKDDDEYYGMKGYIYTSKISSINFTRSTAYDHFNCGWYPYFIGPFENGFPGLHHFSYAGYYEMITVYENGYWETYYVSSMEPDDAAKDGKSHSPFLVIGENRISDSMAEYCPSANEEGYKMLSVGASVSGDFYVPQTVDGNVINSIASYAFSTNDDITSITIPETITSIDEYAFSASKNLTSIKVMSPEPIDLSYSYVIGESAEEGDGEESENRYKMTPFELVDKSKCVLYVPRGSRDVYALAIGWGDFENIEEHDDLSLVDGAQIKNTSMKKQWHSLTGIKYNTKPTTKGIYILEGKKQVVK